MKPFVDFYRSNQISPVAQDITDPERHRQRRDALYRHLGLVPAWLRGHSVVEFGPGSGYNAIHTASLGPSRYVLVDGNPTGLAAAHRLLDGRFPKTDFEFVETLIEDFQTDERFDLVICEGTIPFQIDPSGFLKRIARFAAPGGIVITTCVDGVSMLAETLRRLAAAAVTRPGDSATEKVEKLLPIFSPHLATLKGMSRSHEDWILDQLIQPLVGRLLSIEDAILALDAEFDAHGSSPHFLTDWRWYKDIHGAATEYNAIARSSYVRNLHNFIDYRAVAEPRDSDENHRLLKLGDDIFYFVQRFLATRDEAILPEIASGVEQVATSCRECLPTAAAAFTDYNRIFQGWRKSGRPGPFGEFAACFGRGQQYLSFIRR